MSRRAGVVLTSGVALLGAGVYFWLDPAASGLFPKCPVWLSTGWFCPGCGTQRAVHALLHGRILEALSFNLFAVLALPYLAVGLWRMGRRMWTGSSSQRALAPAWTVWLFLAGVLAFTLWRNLGGPIGSWLAP
ncbi:MAG: DUF2752 domain-containing protein [Bacteroidota bacterium]